MVDVPDYRTDDKARLLRDCEALTRQHFGIFRQLIADIIETGRTNGVFRPDVQPALDASLILAALVGILIEHFLSGDPEPDPTELLAHLKRAVRKRLTR